MARKKLPNRRQSYSMAFQHQNIDYTATASIYGATDYPLAVQDVLWGEVFLSPSGRNSESQVGAMARDSAVLVSLALQQGTPLNTLRKALCRDSSLDAAETETQGLPEIVAYSGPIGIMLDQMAKWRDEWLKEQANGSDR